MHNSTSHTASLIRYIFELHYGYLRYITLHSYYRVSQNYPNMYFSTIISTALKTLKMWIPKRYEILIKRQS